MECMIVGAAEQAWDRNQWGYCREVWDPQRKLNVMVYRDGQRDEVRP